MSSGWPSTENHALPPHLPFEQVLQTLEQGKIGQGRGRIRWSSNYTFLISVCQDDFELKAIYKPRQGERPLWDFPDGTLCLRERAAFLVSEALQWYIVPPTILRDDAPRGLGSLQLYIEHNPEITYFNLDDSYALQLQRMAVFDYLTNNADRKGGHCLLGEGNKLWGIDHGICFHVAPKLRTVIWDYAGMSLPSAILDDLQTLHQNICQSDAAPPSDLTAQLGRLISPSEYQAFVERTERLIKAGKFPEPGYGPSYPWPPI